MVKVVTFAAALTHSSEHGETTVVLSDVVNELKNDDGLADARATERADFTTLGERADEVDDLDAGFEDVCLGVLIGELRSRAVNWVTLF